jgi:hypothetical protein
MKIVGRLEDLKKMSKAEFDTELSRAFAWQIQTPGLSSFIWDDFRDVFGRLSVREKLRPTHWHRELDSLLMSYVADSGLPQDDAIVSQVITDLMNESRSWCNPEIGVDDAAAQAALRKALDQLLVLAAQVSIGTDVQSEDSGQLSQPVDVVDVEARKAYTEALVRECAL